MWKHSVNDPNSNEFPSKKPDGILPHASAAEIHTLTYQMRIFINIKWFILLFKAQISIFFKPFWIALSSNEHWSSDIDELFMIVIFELAAKWKKTY